jgi:hypothetical protein
VDRPGKLGTLVRGAQSERPKKEKVDGSLRGGALARWARTGGCDEDIDVGGTANSREIKAAGGRRSAVD